MSTHFAGDTALLTGRSLRHITRSLDTIITTTIMPIAFLLLFVFVFGGAIDTGTASYIDYLLPGILIITVASGVSYTAYRLFLDQQSGIFERFHSMPIARSSVLWSYVLTSLAAIAMSVAGRRRRRPALRLPFGGRSVRVAGRGRHPRAVHPGADLACRDPRADGEVRGRSQCVLVPADPPAVHQLRLRAHRDDALARCGPSPRTNRSPPSSTPSATCSPGQPVGTDIWVALGWCLGLLAVAYGFAMLAYRRKLA